MCVEKSTMDMDAGMINLMYKKSIFMDYKISYHPIFTIIHVVKNMGKYYFLQ